MLVTVEPQAMAEPVRKEFVVRTVATRSHDGASGAIHRPAEFAGPRGIERRILRSANNLKDLLNLCGRFPKNSCACNVGLVALNGAPAVDQHDVALSQVVWLLRPVGKRRSGSNQNQSASAKIHFRKTRGDEVPDLLFRHT